MARADGNRGGPAVRSLPERKTLFHLARSLNLRRVVRPVFRPSNGFLGALAVVLALMHALLALTATVDKSMTSDEIAHLTAGHVYNTRSDYRLQPENGILSQRWVGGPLTLQGAALPSEDLPAWRKSDVWNYGHTLFYKQGLNADAFLFSGRASVTLFSAATGLLVFFISRTFFGWPGAFLSLLLFTFSPTFLAHGALATSDTIMSFFFLAAVWTWWRHLERPGLPGAALSALTLGLASVAKFSAVLLVPIYGLIAIGWLTAGGLEQRGWPAVRRVLRSSLGHLIVAWATIWLFYGFRFSPYADGGAGGANYYPGWDALLVDLGGPRAVLLALRDYKILPDAFLYGFTFVLQYAQSRSAFLNGEYSLTGWVSFFPYAFLIKTTLPVLLLTAGLVVAQFRSGWQSWRTGRGAEVWRRLRPFTPLAALFLIYWLTSLTSHLNIGQRHILPTYPVLFIALGALGAELVRRPRGTGLIVAALALWHVGESMWIRPHYLAYFNQVVGGPAQGWRHLVDSSLDWGQDLPGLRRWLNQHAREEDVFLAYFGTGDSEYEGIRATRLPTLPEVGPPRPWHALHPGVYAISATMLQQVYSPIRGDWTLKLESEYQQLRAVESTFLEYQRSPARRAELHQEMSADRWNTAWRRYELLRFARLCHYLRVRPADAQVGYSILIFRLSADEIAGTTQGSLDDWSRWIERAITARP